MDPDRILIYKMQQGDDAAWEAFVRRYYGDILKYCFFHTRQRETAEDLTQEVFLRFFAALSRYRHLGKAKNYLYTIAANLCRDAFAQNMPLSLEEAGEQGWDPSRQLDDRLMVEDALRRLPPELREVVLLHYYQDLTLAETAAVLRIGLPLVKYRLGRAKDLLRKETDHA